VEAFAQVFADNQNLINALPALFDIDYAVGVQLDRVGERVGRTRFLSVPLPNVYFSFDVDNQGYDQGVWYEKKYNPEEGIVRLDDDSYRVLLYATVAANIWDGSIPGAYAAWDTVFKPLGYHILIQDYGDMTMAISLINENIAIPDAVTLSLFTTGQLDLKPAGVKVIAHLIQSVPGVALFGFDIESDSIMGWDTGAWGSILP
jgi:hypothetical protein